MRDFLAEATKLKENGDIRAAITVLYSALEQRPANLHLLSELTHCLILSGQISDAELLIQKTRGLNSDFPTSYWNDVRLRLKKQDLQGALSAALAAHNRYPNDLDGLVLTAICLRNANRLEESLQHLEKALEIDPDHLEARMNRGLIRLSRKDEAGCLEDFEIAFQKNPLIKPLWNHLIGLKIKCGQIEGAEHILNKVLQLDPNNPNMLFWAGYCQHRLGKYEAAVKCLKQAIHLKPDFADAHALLGTTFKYIGNRTDAIESLSLALKYAPQNAKIHFNLSLLKKYKEDTPHFIDMVNLYNESVLDDEQKFYLYFALAKAYEDFHDYESSFGFYKLGNEQRRKLHPYSISKEAETFAKLKGQSRILASLTLPIAHSQYTCPIFIVGMPRSGTTLAEQIISAHSEVTGLGELNFIDKFGSQIADGRIAPSKQNLSVFRDQYLSEVKKLSSGKPYVTDKMPHNFKYVALIKAALPEAKIIHVRRNPEATCWSIFKSNFNSNAIDYSNNLDDLVAFYRLYADITAFWYELYPQGLYLLDYELLTTSQEAETSNMINAVGLSWEENCLAPQDNARAVKTASSEQVRQKVYQGSSLSWRKYKRYLETAFRELADST